YVTKIARTSLRKAAPAWTATTGTPWCSRLGFLTGYALNVWKRTSTEKSLCNLVPGKRASMHSRTTSQRENRGKRKQRRWSLGTLTTSVVSHTDLEVGVVSSSYFLFL